MLQTKTKPLASLTAADLMSTEVMAIPQHMSLRTAAHLLSQSHVSGAPVVDEMGRCIGVLSSTDFVSWTDRPEPAHPKRNDCACVHSAWQVLNNEELATDEVCQHMTPDPVTAVPGMPIGKLSRMMRDAHIHRLIVVDRENHPIGVVSSTDVLAAVANALEPTAS